MSEEKRQMTERGYNNLVERLEYLKTTRREEISINMGRAIEDGDLRESAAYDEARMEQSENEALIAELEHQLRRAVVVKEHASGSVGLGSMVTVRMNGKERTFELVSGFEADTRSQKISDESPVGKALLGARKGDTVTAKTPKGDIAVEVLDIQYQD